MTSPTMTALALQPADATITDNPQHTNDMANLTAEAQAQAPTMPVEEVVLSLPDPEPTNDTDSSLQLQSLVQPVEDIQNGIADQNKDVSHEVPPNEETPHIPEDAAIPNNDHIQNNNLVPARLGSPIPLSAAAIPNSDDLQNDNLMPASLGPQPALSAQEMINVLAQLRDDTAMQPFPDFNNWIPNVMEAETMAMMANPFQNLEPEPIQEQQIQAYAKLDFDDGSVYMNTYNMFIGRDRKAAKAAMEREQAKALGLETAEPASFPPPVSASGGIVAQDDDFGSTGHSRSKKGRSKRSRSKASRMSVSSHSSQKASLMQEESYGPNGYMYGQYPIQWDGRDTEAARAVDPISLRPDPNSCPTVGIHPRNDTHLAYKVISRRHVKIAFNPNISVFELHVIGNNGCFLVGPEEPLDKDTPLQMPGTIHRLYSGSKVQIGEVVFTFLLPNGGIEATDDLEHYDEDSQAQSSEQRVFRDGRGKEMSTDHSQLVRSSAGEFSDDDDEDHRVEVPPKIPKKPVKLVFKTQPKPKPEPIQPVVESSSVEEEDEGNEEDNEEESQSSSNESVEGEEEEEEEPTQIETLRQSIEEDGSPTATTKGAKGPKDASRKGPGRPPKNGVMSKRAEKELKKQAEEAAAAEKIGADSGEAPKKGKVGRPRKHPLPDPELANKPKRKYTKRKPKEPQDGATEGAGSGEGATKIKKEKPSKPARSPTPQYNEAELTQEQLSKPSENYVVIIYNAMVASPHKEMGLPQIYNAIKRIYPYFALKAETKGWESSVRHNLSGNPEVFEKGAKDGKGHMWSLKPGATVDKEKKKKAVAEFQGQPQNIQPHNPHGQYYPYANYGPPNPNYPPPQYHPGQYPPPPNGYAPPPNGYPQNGAPWYPPPNYPMPSIPPALMPQPAGGSYSSPYAPKPAEGNAPPPNNQPHASPYGPPPPNGQNPSQQQTQQQPQQQSIKTEPDQPTQQQSTQPPPNLQYPPPNQPQQPSPAPANANHSQQPQIQPQGQAPYPSHMPAPQAPMQNGALPHQYPTPPTSFNPQQPLQNPPPYYPPQPQHRPQQISQSQQIQHTHPLQQQNPPTRMPSPPRQTVETKPIPPPVQERSPEVIQKIEKMLGEFQKILVEKGIANENIINASIALIKRDGDRAAPDPNMSNSSEKNSMKLIIESLRTSLSTIEGSGFTSPQIQFARSFPAPSPTTTLPQSTASPRLSSPSLSKNSPIPRPPIGPSNGMNGMPRPPMHTGFRRTESGSPSIPPQSIQRPASASSGVHPAPTPMPAVAAASPAISAQSGNADSPNGASAATAIPVPEPIVPISEGVSKPQQQHILDVSASASIERPAADVDVTKSVVDLTDVPKPNGQPQTDQSIGRKRSRDEADDVLALERQESVKRLASTPVEQPERPASVDLTAKVVEIPIVPNVSNPYAQHGQNIGRKRSRDESDDTMALERQESVKRVAV